ncbi:P-glycoprotein [Salpingoeca rosetta]|uniref:p-glycoprotein n=1 Tax=Salpingoeca rosetta (strain ATCC 50818 / BSB-021) TaxID=946362 RepID=F2UAH3_SALR5|nr:P-glycoprotein [Salpingoeca rosetta]EGD73389.1 P-glycoprotein [Salpingoeca rosetta]|eukprot:XP_004993671.1 P-glycoprotein [Salpingoeca rosetta]
MASTEKLAALLPDQDEDSVEYLASMLEDYSIEADDDILGFLEDMIGDETEAKDCFHKIKRDVLKVEGADGADQEDDGKRGTLLNKPIIMAKAAEEHEARFKDASNIYFGETVVNVNSTIPSWKDAEEPEIDMSPEAMMARAKAKKKDAKREKKQLKRERVVAPVRTAILEKLTQKPVVIHHVLGEDGSYGGSPCVDIVMKSINIDLAGMHILADTDLTLVYGRRYGLIGRNGIGKTTFLKHLSAKVLDGVPWYLQILHIEQEVAETSKTPLQMVLETDEDRERLLRERVCIEKVLNGGLPSVEETEEFGIKAGDAPIDRLQAVYDELEEIDADEQPARAARILAGLSFTPEMMRKPMKEFSGGWRMRVSLARALFIEPDVLLLDEPTNHLDLHAVLWLENYLKNYENTVVIVSHARGFLNEVCTDILLMKDHTIKRYKGNYDTFEETRHEEQQRNARARESAEKKRAELESFIRKNIGGNAKGASMAKSRQKQLEKMAAIPDSGSIDPAVRFAFPEAGPVAGGFGIRLVGVSFHYPGGPTLFKGVDFSINQNSRICLVGPNGIGKSTLLKIVYEELEPVEGMVTRNQRLRVGRFSQHHVDTLQTAKSPVELFQDKYPTHPPQKIRKHLGGMGIIGDLQLRPINTLSGGQKSRVALASITYEAPHLLLLDEPTNHLDLDTVQALIRALADYDGGVMIVSHDEHLIKAVCDELWIIRDKQVILSKGDFDDYKKSIQEQFKQKEKKKKKN